MVDCFFPLISTHDFRTQKVLGGGMGVDPHSVPVGQPVHTLPRNYFLAQSQVDVLCVNSI